MNLPTYVASLAAAACIVLAKDEPLLGTIPPSIVEPAPVEPLRREVPVQPCVELFSQLLTQDGPCAEVILSLSMEVRIWRQYAEGAAATAVERFEDAADARADLARCRAGDLNGDGNINNRDLDILVAIIASQGGPPPAAGGAPHIILPLDPAEEGRTP